ncbi:YecA family protein [Pseudomonas amygdali]|uniref:YecA family protein n=1 Tax=Pseudomonas amygdali TaxID=47877 RepID=UPI000CD1545C|nr:SEC-C metal-binding domain-containing protein [Pseudomonas amygdali]
MTLTDRSETEIFADLMELTAQPGYAHAIAYICHRDNLVAYKGEWKASDMSHLFDPNRLIRTEITTLLGLMVRQPLELTLPDIQIIEIYVFRSDELMAELHGALNRPSIEHLLTNALAGGAPTEIWSGSMMREPIFYATESAYSFQYRDFLVKKHAADDGWLEANKGFTSVQAQRVAHSMCLLMDERATATASSMGGIRGGLPPKSLLDHFEFDPADVSARSGLDVEVVGAVFDALTLKTGNAQFNELGDFNAVAATPLIPTGRGTVLLFLHYSIYEALYESPFFWMIRDKSYREQASDNRGAFAENFAHERLVAVFGAANVHLNVNIYDGKDIVGEADVLVVFGDRIIIVQAKAKKLTLEARKGNDGQLKNDFSAAIQKASDQAWECGNALLSGICRLETDKGYEVVLPESIREIYPFCVVSDHYPALAFQASQFLQFQSTEIIRQPFVMDVFLLDVLSEMLDSPLRLLSYVRLRLAVTDKIMASHELTTLGYHLRRNLWLTDEFQMMMLDDSIASDLDAAMMVRREGFRGKRVPPGILTVMTGTLYERLIEQIERRADPAILELGFQLLSMGEDSCLGIHRGLTGIIELAKLDRRRHDFTVGVGAGETGICFHCNPLPTTADINALRSHCERRKYALRADVWFGVSVGLSGDLQFGVTLDSPWEKSATMDALTKDMKAPAPVNSLLKSLEKGLRPIKYGRNDPCPCGSGRKYKKCCIS